MNYKIEMAGDNNAIEIINIYHSLVGKVNYAYLKFLILN